LKSKLRFPITSSELTKAERQKSLWLIGIVLAMELLLGAVYRRWPEQTSKAYEKIFGQSDAPLGHAAYLTIMIIAGIGGGLALLALIVIGWASHRSGPGRLWSSRPFLRRGLICFTLILLLVMCGLAFSIWRW